MPRILSRATALACMTDRSGHKLLPRMTQDGRPAVDDSIVGNASYADVAALLAGSPSEAVASWHSADDAVCFLDSKPVFFNNARRAWSIAEVAPDVFRFEVRANDPGTPKDLYNGNRRSEIVTMHDDGWSSGETLWMSWATVLGPHPGLLLTDSTSRFGYVMQIHSGVSGWPPILTLNYAQGMMRVFTQSDEDFGVFKVRYTAPIPAQGLVKKYVMTITLGQSGRVKFWSDGALVLDVSCSVGFWSTGGILGHPQWGLYTKNWNTTDVVYHANVEWGSSSLEARVASPKPVPDLTPWV